MKHLKYFTKMNEEEIIDPSVIYADSWIPSENPEGDYDVTWSSEAGETVTATFKDSGGPIIEDDKVGYSIFETVPGTSSDGKEYIGEVRYKEDRGATDEFLIVSIIIREK